MWTKVVYSAERVNGEIPSLCCNQPQVVQFILAEYNKNLYRSM